MTLGDCKQNFAFLPAGACLACSAPPSRSRLTSRRAFAPTSRTAQHRLLRACSSALVLNSNIVVKVRAFEPGLWPSPIVARTYHFLDPSAQNFSSELPIVIVSTAGRVITENIIGGGNRTRGSLVVIDTFRGRSS